MPTRWRRGRRSGVDCPMLLPSAPAAANRPTRLRASRATAGKRLSRRTSMRKTLLRTAVLALAVAVTAQPQAQTAPTIKFTEAKLANGLRVIIAEDHSAPVYSIVVHYLVGSKDERKGRTGLRASVRAHDVQGLGERRSRRALHAGVHQRRLDERDDQQGPHAVLRDAAVQSARPRHLSRSRSHEVAGDHQGESRQPAQRRPGRAAARASTTSRTASRSRPSIRWPTTTRRTSTR